jgi:hypothetical protein
MVGADDMAFPELEARTLEAYAHAKASDLGLPIPTAYLPAVLETLAALQVHAAILAAALT